MRLIDVDRAELYDAIGRNAFRNRQDIIDLINNQPIIDAVPVVHGRWIGIPLCGSNDCECSECGNWCNIHVNLCGEAIQKYCPYCGAKMDGGANNAVS